MKTLVIATTSLLFAAPVYAQTMTGRSSTNSGLSSPTTDFVKNAAVGGMFEIQSSQLAAQKANGSTRNFAEQMINDHQKMSNDLKSVVQDQNAEASMPSQLDKSHQEMLDKLQRLNGAAFERQYKKDQIVAHKQAVALFKHYAKTGDDAALKTWADQSLPELEHHLNMADNLKS
jgi:putative membrane protein